jgi:hypothetical protein
MTAGWCVRYGNLLGINNHSAALQLLGRPVWMPLAQQSLTYRGMSILIEG